MPSLVGPIVPGGQRGKDPAWGQNGQFGYHRQDVASGSTLPSTNKTAAKGLEEQLSISSAGSLPEAPGPIPNTYTGQLTTV